MQRAKGLAQSHEAQPAKGIREGFLEEGYT